ncbi:IS4 family transposase [Rhodoferax sp.]|uniref:IS4 family transposase n=1 Tax=Rhodoferax sp. TaxID=50421 RepID=UPI0039B8E204
MLPAAVHRGGTVKSPRRLDQAVPAAIDVPAQAGDVRALTLIIVDRLDLMRVWNELMLREHPQGAGPLVGAQMRYLIGSEHGWLGGFGFGAAALHMADRDQWIGWSPDLRRQQMHRVVGMSRFLIRTSVDCQNLASMVQGMVLRRLGADYEAQYGYRPWLVESFVDTAHFIGTSYRAANWLLIGKTQGRGRQDRDHAHAKTVKSIYVYALQADWRARMGVAEPVPLAALDVAEGLEGDEWAAHEFGGADLGDKRTNERLVEFAGTLAAMPGRAFCAAAQGDKPAIKSYYRMIEQADDSQLTMAAILAPHQQRTVQRMKAQSTVLCIQDGTDLNYSSLVQCDGLGVIGSNQTGAQSGGLHLHSTLVVTTQGLPLGVLGAQCSAPQPRAKDDTRPTSAIPIQEKKTFAWIEGLRQCNGVAAELPDTRQVLVMDREADFYELFDEQRRSRRVELLVRAKHDRATGEELRLFDSVRQSPVKGQLQIPVPRQSSRAKKSKQKARAGHKQRTAHVELRWRELEFGPPSKSSDKKALTLRVVHVLETSPPLDAEPVEWFLLTTCEIATTEQAQDCLRWYCLRWRIEDWHRVLKSGCRIEALQHKTAERLKRAIAINLVIAWRIMLMTLLGRTVPDLPAELLFSDLEIEVLQAYAKKNESTSRLGWAMPYAS